MSFKSFDLSRVPSPCYVVDEAVLENNLEILAYVQKKSGAKILLALKAFSMFSVAPQIMRHLHGVCASGLNEAKLGREEFNGEVHTYAAAFRPHEFEEILSLSNHVVFNSLSQWQRYKKQSLAAQKDKPTLQFGLRINPEHSESDTPIYDPCAPCSRMGVRAEQLSLRDIEGIQGLHFHTLCEQNFAPLQRTLDTIEENFSNILETVSWVNFGGGHHITRQGYDVNSLIDRIKIFQKKWGVQVYLEPGEAIALDAGVLICEVLDTLHNEMDLAIVDTSATCHMPDVLEMPYRPRLTFSGDAGELNHTYRLGGPSCLAGDIIGDYSFTKPLLPGSRLMFEDMAIYTMVKNSTFNGINLPSIALWNSNTDNLRIVKDFSYNDFKMRLS